MTYSRLMQLFLSGYMRADKIIKLQVSHEHFVWGAQVERTSVDFGTNLLNLEGMNRAAAAYLRELNPSQWAAPILPYHPALRMENDKLCRERAGACFKVEGSKASPV